MNGTPTAAAAGKIDVGGDLTVNRLGFGEAELKRHGKDYEFHRYDGAGHAFFYYQDPMYRPEAAMDGWEKVFGFFGRQLSR